VDLTAPRHATVSWDYASPRGPGRCVDNCSVADATVSVTGSGGTQFLAVRGIAAVEHGRM
jgi:hypothetical protein